MDGLDDFKKWMGTEAPNAPLSQITGGGLDQRQHVDQGIKAAGVSCPTRKAFINNLRIEKGYRANGFFDDPETTIDFAKVYGKPFQCVYYVHVENKEFVPQFGGKPFCAKQLITDNKITQVAATRPAATTTAPPRPRHRKPGQAPLMAEPGPRDPAPSSRNDSTEKVER